ncbi:MAG TPA: nicotinate-nucleotide adenylyltransferase [Caulifigura sp.]|jgi:nicotinate-nucleotide adenylyltransferase|nr:nicotinate-nucleotide adenylyltransferase [Caulifigura sp.]
MRLGLYGGTFDPVHLGHLLLAESCREQLALDEVWFIPTGNPPHKVGVEIAPGKARREMLELALAGLPQFPVSRIEIDRPGPHYTVETLRLVREERPDDELFVLIGADSLHDLHTWREPEAIASMARVVAVNRGLDAGVPRGFTGGFQLASGATIQVESVTMPPIGISATDLRRRVAGGLSIRFQTPRAVEQYIRAHRLYRNSPPVENATAGAAGH